MLALKRNTRKKKNEVTQRIYIQGHRICCPAAARKVEQEREKLRSQLAEKHCECIPTWATRDSRSLDAVFSFLIVIIKQSVKSNLRKGGAN